MSVENQRAAPLARQDRILEMVIAEPTVSAAQVAETFGVSLMTAHRDLDALERRGAVRRFRGGVSALPSNVFDSSIHYRMRANIDEKAAIAREAATLIEPGMAVLLEDSSTTLELARALVDVEPLTVITNFPAIIDVFAQSDTTRVIALGGEYLRNHQAYHGLQCIESLSTVRADIHFNSTSSMNHTHAFHSEPEVVLLKRAMMGAAERSVLLMDHTKIGRTALHVVAPLTDFSDIVVDFHADPADVRALNDHHPQVHVANQADSEDDA